jgi:hypothetical protein
MGGSDGAVEGRGGFGVGRGGLIGVGVGRGGFIGVGVDENDTGEYDRGGRAKFCAGGATESALSDGRTLADGRTPADPGGTLRGLACGDGGWTLAGPGRWVISPARPSPARLSPGRGKPRAGFSGARSTTAAGPR